MEVFASRKPVFDRDRNVWCYELMYRAGFEQYYEALDGEKAEADFVAAIDFEELSEQQPALVTFSPDTVREGLPALLPHDRMIAMLPGDSDPTEPELIQACQNLLQKHYHLGIADFRRQHLDSPLTPLVGLARIDFRDTPPDEQKHLVEVLAGKGITAIADNVDDPEGFDRAVALGYGSFQGAFFQKPVVVPGREIAPVHFDHLRLLRELHSPELSYDQIEEMIKQDVGMTYKLLRFMNSAWFGLRHEVRSIKHALVLLGPKEIARWASLVVLRDMGEQKPRELLHCCLSRARAAELLAPQANMSDRAGELFLMGMFSMIDALLDAPMSEIIDELPLSHDVCAALMGTSGQLRCVYDLILAYQRADWEALACAVYALHVPEPVLPSIFSAARKWASNALSTQI